MPDVKKRIRLRRPSTETFEKKLIAKYDQEGSVRLALQGVVELMEAHMRSCTTCGNCNQMAQIIHRMKRGLKIGR